MIQLLVILLVIGFALWILGGRINPTIRSIIIGLLVLYVALWVLDAFAIVDMPSQLRLGAR